MTKHSIAYIFALFCLIASCSYENEEELFPNTTCESENLSYADDIIGVLSNYSCLSCHSSIDQQGGVNLEDFVELKVFVDNGTLLKSVNQEDGVTPMPIGQAKMSECDIDKLASWINDGAPNN